jgi:hypothetical protein
VRRIRLVLLVFVLLLAAASVSIHAGGTLRIVDAQGQPIRAYVAYRYQGSTLNPVHPVTYNASAMALVQADADGRVTFPLAVHVHLPFPLQTHPSRWVEMVYAPSLHNALARFGSTAISERGVFEFDRDARRVVMTDASEQPAIWEGTLSTLSSMIQQVVPKPFRPDARLRDRDPTTAGLALELIGQFRQEYDAYLARHGDAVRPMPPRPQMWNDEDKRRWGEMVAADLAAEPTRGIQARRLYGYYSTYFREYEAELR